MGKLTSIYNFVPLNEQVFYPSWADQVSQDAPFSDGEDGYIDVTLRNVSPLFIRNGNADRNTHDPHSAHVMVDGKRLYFLPATSIKGMLRSTLEIMSFGKMTQYTDRFFGFRDLGNNQTSDGKAYLSEMEKIKPGWLRWDSEEEKLYLSPCDDKIELIEDTELLKLYPSFKYVYSSERLIVKTGWQKNKAIREDGGELYPLYTKNGKQYRIVCTGNFSSKKLDFLFPVEKLNEFEVEEGKDKKDKLVTMAFFTVHEPTPDFKTAKSDVKGKSGLLNQTIVGYLESGGILPVFYVPGDKDCDVKAIGLSKLIRMPYRENVGKIIITQQKNLVPQNPDLAEAIFGYTNGENNDSLRGRVQFGNAFSDTPIADDELGEGISGVLGQPKASFYPFYLNQTNNPYKTYNNPDGIAGRKLYRIHRGGSTTKLPQGNSNKNTKGEPFFPIPSNQTFNLRIVVHNLRKMEIGALLSALTLHNTKNVWHNIGLARGYGYGKLAIDDVKLSNNFSFTKEEYLKEFEYQMSLFTLKYSSRMWIDTPQITRLMQIHSEHDDADLHVMTLDEYGEASKNDNFGTLEEKSTVSATSLLTPTEKSYLRKHQWTDAHKADYADADSLFNGGKYDEAIAKLNAMVDELRILGLETTDEDALIEKVRNSKNAEFEKQQQDALAKQEEAKKQKISAGLGATLDEVFAEGTPKAGQYKVADFKGLNNRTDQWIKKLKETSLTNSEKSDYASTFRRLAQPGTHPKKEDKDLANKKSKLWQTAQKRLEDSFDTLLGDLYKQ